MLKATGKKAFVFLSQPFFWPLLILLTISGCDSCRGIASRQQTGSIELYRPTVTDVVRAPSPASPLGAPVAPVADMQSPETPVTAHEPNVQSDYEVAVSKFRQIRTGMTYDEIAQLLESPGARIAGSDSANAIHQWTLAGITLMGRFENNTLIRSNVVNPSGSPIKQRSHYVSSYNQELYDAVHPGMRQDEVMQILGTEPETLTGGAGTVKIFKWADNRGSTIIGRFDNGILIRKSGQIAAAESGDGASAPIQEEVAPDVPYRFPITDEDVSDIPEEGEIALPPSGQVETVEENADVETAPRRIHVAGASRREREMETDTSPYAGRSYKPTAKLPEYTRQIRRGDFEIRIDNQSTVSMDVAVISNEGGKDISIASGGRASIFVGRGTYDLYYIYSDDPFTLYRGQQIPVDATLADFIVTLYDDSYSVNFLDRNMEPSSDRPRR